MINILLISQLKHGYSVEVPCLALALLMNTHIFLWRKKKNVKHILFEKKKRLN